MLTMSDPFVKLYATLLESSLWWGEDEHTRIIWITLLVAADYEGLYLGTLPGLAGKARVTLDQARHAVWRLQQPDEESRTPDNDGRRIEVIPGVGFKLLNYQKYRDKRSPKQVSDAAYKAAQRARNRGTAVPDMSNESVEASKISLLGSEISPDPDPDRARELLPHEKSEARKLAALETPGTQPALRYQFPPDWIPRKRHRARGIELGLTEDEILERAEDCRLKPIKQGYVDEDKHFMRELTWAARDKETRKAKEQAYANRKDFETPGHNRK